jgi:hypothetical protein
MALARSLRCAFGGLKRSATAQVRRVLQRSGLIEAVEYSARVSPQYPDLKTLPEKTLCIVSGDGYQKWAYLVCPCGCGERLMLSLAKSRRPRWHIDIDWLDRPTIRPSIWQTDGCYSHFWVKKGRIEWTPDTGKPRRLKVGDEA